MLTGEPNLSLAAKAAIAMGPSVVVAKRGEYGALLFTGNDSFAVPGLPLEEVRDPTGAGDSFAGGFLGYLDGARIAGTYDESALRRAMVHGSVMASLNVEDFGTDRVSSVTPAELGERYQDFKRLMTFEDAGAIAWK
jgi:sugar/nucleoside kinase (ribokinase family)